MRRNKTLRGFILLFVYFILMKNGSGQFSMSNVLEYQLGNLPNTEPANMSTLYDQLNMTYRYDLITLAAKVEQFQSADRQTSYTDFVQKSIRINHDDLGLVIGNFYHIVGRGLLLRSYEIPGAVIEDLGLRSRYGFYRDMDGFMASYTPDFAEIYLFRGRPLNNIAPPIITDDIRRPHLLEGGEARFYLSPFMVSGSYLRDNIQTAYDEYGSLAAEANLPYNVQITGEYAAKMGTGYSFFDLSNQTPHAFYLGANWLYGEFGMSAEYKDYYDFLLGYNDPPTLVKEHQYLLLNRSTHRLIPANESGWQTEFFYRFIDGMALNVNIAESVNEFYDNRYLFSEQFAEISYPFSDQSNAKIFIDHSLETLVGIQDRYTGGVYLHTQLDDFWSADIDLEYQQFRQEQSVATDVKNYALLLTISRAPDFSAGITIEKSNDPVDLPEGKESEYWLGGNIAYQYSQVHLLSLFLGKRRGGNACNSGICYEILPFEGIEFRLTSIL